MTKNKPKRSLHGQTLIVAPLPELLPLGTTPAPMPSPDAKAPRLRIPLHFLCKEHRGKSNYHAAVAGADTCWRCQLRAVLWEDHESRPWHHRDPEAEFNLILILPPKE